MMLRRNAKRNTRTSTSITRSFIGLAVISGFLSCFSQASEFMSNLPIEDRLRLLARSIKYKFPDNHHEQIAVVHVPSQQLYLFRGGALERSYPVSTSRFGVGNEDGSLKTPLGVHRVVQKIGDGVPSGTIFRGRVPTSEMARIFKSKIRIPNDFVTTRILQLEGLEPGINRGRGIDSYARHVYIHGTHEEGMIGQPASIGCIRMTNADVIELFDLIERDALVVIVE